MLETRCVRIKLKPGMVPRAREWAAEINRRKAEAYASLRVETVVIECAFLDEGSDGDYLIYFMKAKDLGRAGAPASAGSVDEYHQHFKEAAWESGKRLEPLIDLDLTDEMSSG